jgi:hypothetical protein
VNLVEYTTPEILQQQILEMDLDTKLYVVDVPNEVYHGTIGWSSSHAKKAFQSEQRLHRYLQEQKISDPKDHFVFGELVHDSIRLSPQQIDEVYCDSVRVPDGRTNLGKALKAVFNSGFDLELTNTGFNLKPEAVHQGRDLLDQINGRQVISRKAKDEARELADTILNQYTVSDALSNNKAIYELSVWHKMRDGFIRKCRTDCFLPDIGVVFDWKTSRELVWTFATDNRHHLIKRELTREIDKRDYALSAAWYMDILGLIDDGAFMLLFADKDALEVYPPYLFDVERLHQENRRCKEAISAIKSYRSKIVEGKVIQPLTTFLPNDDYLFSGNEKDYL